MSNILAEQFNDNSMAILACRAANAIDQLSRGDTSGEVVLKAFAIRLGRGFENGCIEATEESSSFVIFDSAQMQAGMQYQFPNLQAMHDSRVALQQMFENFDQQPVEQKQRLRAFCLALSDVLAMRKAMEQDIAWMTI